MKSVLGIKRSSTVVNNNQQQSTVVNNNQQLSTVDFYNKRDLQYARRIGQIEQMANDIAMIKEKITGLDIKFDMRIQDKVLTEKRFEEEVNSNEDFFRELEEIRKSVEEMKIIINNQQLSTVVNNNQQQSTVVNNNQQLKILKKIEKSADNLESSIREKEILKQLNGSRLSSDEIGNLIGISRSRANQILIEMERKGLVFRIKYGKKILWGKK
ncbi:MAG: winged helix-turn-helix domain-containing protein [Candidatus Aenigmatarchaeota archaeon]|nr:winged helix-turn-helix domain-containing protein [Candidatus Aenigmarchaeota archaeon]